MRSAVLWLIGASAAFFATAAAFLLLANLGAGLGPEGPIPRASPSGAAPTGPALVLRFAEDRLKTLERAPDQTLTLYVENTGEEELPVIDLTLDVTSGGNARTNARSYRTSVEKLAPGATEAVELTIDLSSPPVPAEGRETNLTGEELAKYRSVLEARVSAPGSTSDVQTAVLSL